jgi:hypothetical protein
VTEPGGQALQVPGSLSGRKLGGLRKNLSDGLGNFKRALGDELDQHGNWDALSNALGILYHSGHDLLRCLFPMRHAERTYEVFTRMAMAAERGWRYPVVEVNVSAPDFVPLEFLPVLDPGPPGRIDSYDKLKETAMTFLGFFAAVRRSFPPSDDAPWAKGETQRIPRIDNFPRLPLKLFQCVGLKGAASEADFFRSIAKHVDLDGPWPSIPMTGEDVGSLLARHLWDPSLGFDGKVRECPDQVHHFACHFTLNEHSLERSFLTLGGDSGPTTEVPVSEIEYQLYQFAGKQGWREKSTLVFANACRASVINPEAVSSLPELFRNNGNLGFIGTEADIPDAVAAEFSKRFYRHLLRGYTLGDSSLMAKRELLRAFHNPFGILYTFYAEPDIRVRKPADI